MLTAWLREELPIQPKNRVKSERRRRGRQGPTQNISSGNNESQDKELEMRMSGAQCGATAELWPVMLQWVTSLLPETDARASKWPANKHPDNILNPKPYMPHLYSLVYFPSQKLWRRGTDQGAKES